MTRRKAVVAMSGGVDSSVAAALLVEEGYDVTGIMLKLWKGGDENNNSGCCSLGAAEDARRVADVLGMPFYVFNFAERFEETVIRDFQTTYVAGKTPNPCIRCNQWIKFDALLERSRELGAAVLATGHYARRQRIGERYRLLRGVDPAKDQSYVLWMLTQAELAHCVFPVGAMPKSETRKLAEELGLRTATKPDSQEICFVREGDLGEYLSREVPEADAPGPVVDQAGREIGRHRGFARYTIGQRKGLGVSLGHPVFVTDVDPTSNTVVVGDQTALEVSGMTLDEASFVDEVPDRPEVLVQYRAHGEPVPARIFENDPRTIHFDEPAVAVAPGQSAAIYSASEPDVLLGGGIIAKTVRAAAPAGSAL